MANDLVLRVSLPDEPTDVIATGGEITYVDGYIVHAFTSSATFQITQADPNKEIEVFLVGGGGAGAQATTNGGGGGGGGGGVLIDSIKLSNNFTYSIQVGAGGTTLTDPPSDVNHSKITSGSNVISIARGGGCGARPYVSPFRVGQPGGSGGGGAVGGVNKGLGVTTDGNLANDGGEDITGNFGPAGGGGGAGAVGGSAFNSGTPSRGNAGSGGAGVSNNWLGSPLFYGAGGGGGATTPVGQLPNGQGLGGSGIGGDGAYDESESFPSSAPATAAAPNRGAGGGGGTPSQNYSLGSDGIVLIRYKQSPLYKIYDLDTPSDIDFRIDLSAIENTEIGSVFGVASQTFELPSSKTNDEFFSAAFNVNSTSVRGLKNSVDCQVLSNGGEIFKGNLVLKEVITDGYNNTTYSVEVVNETIDFQTLIQDQFISDLDFSDYTHSYTMASVTSSWTGSLFGGDIVYPLADYGVDSSDSTLPLIELGNQRGKMDNPSTPLKTIQFKPAIRVKAVLDNIFESVGYRYSSSFFDSSEFQNIYVLPTATDKLGIQSQAYQDAGFYVNKTTSQTFADSPSYFTVNWEQEQWDPSGGFNLSTETFTVQTAGQYAFRLELNVSAPDGTASPTQKEFTVRLKVNGGSSFAQFYDLVGNTAGTMTFVTPGQTLDAGDTVQVDARYRIFSTGTTPDATITGGFFQTIYAPTTLIGGNVDMGQQFEENAKSIDFLTGLIEMFNLVVEPKKDERKTLIIEPFDTWRDSGVIKDWTHKWDSATKISIKHPIQDQPRTLIHQLEDDDDALNAYSKAQFDRDLPYGTNTYTADSDIAQGERKVGSFFAPTPTKGVVGGNNVIIPHLYKSENGEKKPIKFKPRLLYLIPNRGTLDAVAGKIWVKQDSGFTVGITSYATMNHLSSLPADGSTKSLHFNANKWYPYHNNFAYGYTINGLFNEYWGRYINELYDDEARVMTCNIHFDPYELPTIQLNDKIFIKDAYYRINKISGYNLSKRASVQVELLKAPVSRFKFKRHRRVRIGDITADLTLSDFNPISGQATYVDVETGQTYSSGSFLKNIAKLDALAFQGDKAVYTPEFNLTLQTSNKNNLDGNLNQDASIGYALGSITEGSVGKDVDRAIAVGSNIDLQQSAKSVMTIGDGLTVADGSTYSTILNTKDATIEAANNYGFIIGGSGSSISGGDYVGIINSEIATARDSDYTTIINGHTDDVVVNGNGHVVINMDKAGAGIDLLNYRSNSNYLGDTYFGGSQFIEPETLTCGDGTTINLYDTQYQDNSLFILNWTGVSPGTTTINLPNLTNNDYKKIHYRIKANGTFDGTTLVKLVPFTSPQTIEGLPSSSFSSSYDYIEIYAQGTDWLVLGSTI